MGLKYWIFLRVIFFNKVADWVEALTNPIHNTSTGPRGNFAHKLSTKLASSLYSAVLTKWSKTRKYVFNCRYPTFPAYIRGQRRCSNPRILTWRWNKKIKDWNETKFSPKGYAPTNDNNILAGKSACLDSFRKILLLFCSAVCCERYCDLLKLNRGCQTIHLDWSWPMKKMQ